MFNKVVTYLLTYLNPGGGTTEAENRRWGNAVPPAFTLTLTTENISVMYHCHNCTADSRKPVVGFCGQPHCFNQTNIW